MTHQDIWKSAYFTDFGKVFTYKRKDGTTSVKIRNARSELRLVASKTGKIRVVDLSDREVLQ